MSDIDHGQNGPEQIPALPEQGRLDDAHERAKAIAERFGDLTSVADHAVLEGTTLEGADKTLVSEVLDPARALMRARHAARAAILGEE